MVVGTHDQVENKETTKNFIVFFFLHSKFTMTQNDRKALDKHVAAANISIVRIDIIKEVLVQ